MATLSSPTLERLIKEVRIFLNQPQKTNSFWTDEELTLYLNDGVRMYFLEVNERSEGQFDVKTTLDLVQGQETVDLPTDCFEVKALYASWNSQLRMLAYKNNLTNSLAKQPAGGPDYFEPFYYFRGNSLVLSPTPDFSLTGGLVLEYTAFPEQMIWGGDVMTSKISPVFKELIVMYAVYKAKVKESLVTGTNTAALAQAHLGDLFKAFKEDIGSRSKYPQQTVPYKG